ncbi:MAG: hypothetical protein NTU88_12910, partial [Armatimonadetes bacterium]|nr:hypothetical protein [Armatimonadota bacterium]
MHAQSLDGEWQLSKLGADEWIPAAVPGCVHTDLMAAGVIPDPFEGDNEKRVAWVAETDWVYRRSFSADEALLAEERVFLECDGFDTLATIRLNGEEIARSENMHRSYRLDVTGRLRPGENEIELEFASPVNYVRPKIGRGLVTFPGDSIPGAPYLRKAMYQWGWDWGPKLPTSGIWRSIRLAGYSAARIEDVRIRQVHGRTRVEVHVETEIERFSDAGLVLRARLTSPDGVVLEEERNLGADGICGAVDFLVEDPKLWWPNGYGEHALYELEVELLERSSERSTFNAQRPTSNGEHVVNALRGVQESEGSTPNGGSVVNALRGVQKPPSSAQSADTGSPQRAIPTGPGGQALDVSAPSRPLARSPIPPLTCDASIDSRSTRIGLRQIELRREKDEWGESFYFAVNGVPIFAKGANWIPADQFPSRIIGEQYLDLISSAVSANMNMLRVWGGGIYEDDRFYDLCDEYGILVWQDFMFACAHYPIWPEMLESIRHEATDNIRRIRHHPCLALWCGNNEMEWGVVDWWHSDKEARQAEYAEIFHRLIPEVCKAEDPATPYWPSSPASPIPFANPNGETEGDGHYWDVWHGRQPFTAYRDHYFRFMSEFGFQSLPSIETVKSFAEPKDWNMTSYIMEQHQKNRGGNGNILYYMAQTFRFPKDFAMMSYVSQLLQAEAIRYGVEHWRRNRNEHRCMGTLYWQLNDCWPVVSWSSMEYNHSWKALHYHARRFYAPVLISAEETPSSVKLHVTNDLLSPFEGEVCWSLEKLDGTALESGGLGASIPAETSVCVAELDFAGHLDDDTRRQVVLVYELRAENERLSMGTVSFIPSKHLELPKACISTEVFEEDGITKIKLSSDALARFVMLDVATAPVGNGGPAVP